MTTAPCNCAARWANVACSCSWRDHLTRPIRVEIPYMLDDGRTVRHGTLTGAVYPDNSVDELELLLDGGEEVTLRGKERRYAESELRQTAHDLWQRSA